MKSACFNDFYSPYELIFGKNNNSLEFLNGDVEPLYNVDIYVKEMKYRLQISHKRAKEFLETLKLRNKNYYDKKLNPINLVIGEDVMLKKEPYKKHSNVYSSPFTVVSFYEHNVTIASGTKTQIVHKNRLVKI